MARKTLLSLVACGAIGLLALAHAAEYNETREMSLPAAELSTLDIACGAGALEVTGDPEAEAVRVMARIGVRGVSKERAKELLAEGLTLTLVPKGSGAKLVAEFKEERGWFRRATRDLTTWVDLTVVAPPDLALEIQDGSGDIHVKTMCGGLTVRDGSGDLVVEEVRGAVDLIDGSGDIRVVGVEGDLSVQDGSGDVDAEKIAGAVVVQDGSGELRIAGVTADVRVTDGSGEISLQDIGGNVHITDGSGGLDVAEVTGDVEVTDGSGDMRLRAIGANVQVRDGSGDIKIDTVAGDATILSAGSGGCTISGVQGRVEQRG